MSQSQFSCPHCSNPFQVDTSTPTQQVACPHCGQPVSITNEPPLAAPPVEEPPPVASPTAPPVASRNIASAPADYSPADLLPPTRVVAKAQSQDIPSRENDVPNHEDIATGEPQATSVSREHVAEVPTDNFLPPTDWQATSPPTAVAQPEPQQVALDDVLFRQQLADDRASRQFIKNTIVWTCCAIVLLVILAYFIRPGGS